MERDRIVQSIGLGAAAGLIGTAAIGAVRTVRQNAVDPTPQARHEEPAKPFRSGTTGALAVYSAFREDPEALSPGALLGLGIWGAGKLGWLPAWHPHRASAKTTGEKIREITQHVLFGVAIVIAYRRLKHSQKTENR